jgi:hypothetical protein
LGCKKKPFDPRNKYCGKWKFTSSSYNWTYGQGATSPTMDEFDGEVYYDKKDKSNLIIIKLNTGWKTTFEIDGSGKITSCGSYGKFDSKDKVSFEYSSSACTLALGGGSYSSFTGTKK